MPPTLGVRGLFTHGRCCGEVELRRLIPETGVHVFTYGIQHPVADWPRAYTCFQGIESNFSQVKGAFWFSTS